MSDPTSTLRLAPGAGLLVRRPAALLFVPGRDQALFQAFMASPDGGELQAVASVTVAAGFAVGPFVALSWAERVQVMVFGELAVETDQPTLPMLTGAGSKTWVEHSLPVTGDAVIEVVAAEGSADPATDLSAGVAVAGGFRLELVGRDERPAAAQAPAAALDGPTTMVPRVDSAESPVTISAPERPEPLPAPPPPAASDDDPAAALAAIQAAAVGADGAPAGRRSTAAPPPFAVVEPGDDDDVTLPPPADEVLARLAGAGSGGPRGRPLVDAKVCSNGHPSPPTVATCDLCGELLAPGTSAVIHVPRPSLGRLHLDDGDEVELDDELLIGRNPDRDDRPEHGGLRRVKVDGDKVSRSHLEVRLQGWDVLIADCGSTNGTFIVPQPGGQVAALLAGRLQLLEPGATVYFGSRSFTVVGRAGVRSGR